MMTAVQIERLREAGRAFCRPESLGFAILIAISTWASLFAPRIMGAVLPVATVLVLGGLFISHRRFCFPPMEKGVWLGWGLVVALVAASHFWSVSVHDNFERIGKIAASLAFAILLFFSAHQLSNTGRLRLRTLFVGSLCFGLFLIAVNMLTDASLYRLVTSRTSVDAAGEGANRAAVVMAVLIWPGVLAAWQNGWRKFAIALVFMALVVALMTESQSAQVSIVLGMFIFGFTLGAPRMALGFVAVAGVAAILGIPFFLTKACPALLHPGIGWHDASAGARLEIWCAIGESIFTSPLIGHGVDATRFVNDWGMAHIYFPDKTVLHPHNAALQIWYEFGLVGAMLASFIWLAFLQRISTAPVRLRAVYLASLGGIFVVAFISHGLWQSWWLGAVGVIPALFRLGTEAPPVPD